MSDNRLPPGYIPLTCHQLNGSTQRSDQKSRSDNSTYSGGGRRSDRQGSRNGQSRQGSSRGPSSSSNRSRPNNKRKSNNYRSRDRQGAPRRNTENSSDNRGNESD